MNNEKNKKIILVQRSGNGPAQQEQMAYGSVVRAVDRTAYTVVDPATNKLPKGLVLRRQGKSLLVLINGQTAAEVSEFFSEQVTDVAFHTDPQSIGTLTNVAGSTDAGVVTQSTPAVAEVNSASPILWKEDAQALTAFEGSAAGTPDLPAVVFGGVSGAAAIHVTGAAPAAVIPASAKVVAFIVGGPVVEGNDLAATIYSADGKVQIGSGTVNADGTVTVSVGSYTGVVIVKVVSTGAHADYVDETTGAPTDLGDTVLYSASVLSQAGGVLYLNVNILTSLAYLKAVDKVGAGQTLDATTVQTPTLRSPKLLVSLTSRLGQLKQRWTRPVKPSQRTPMDKFWRHFLALIRSMAARKPRSTPC